MVDAARRIAGIMIRCCRSWHGLFALVSVLMLHASLANAEPSCGEQGMMFLKAEHAARDFFAAGDDAQAAAQLRHLASVMAEIRGLSIYESLRLSESHTHLAEFYSTRANLIERYRDGGIAAARDYYQRAILTDAASRTRLALSEAGCSFEATRADGSFFKSWWLSWIDWLGGEEVTSNSNPGGSSSHATHSSVDENESGYGFVVFLLLGLTLLGILFLADYFDTRTARRLKVSYRTDAELDGRRVAVKVVNVSRKGLKLLSGETLHKGEELTVHLEDVPVRARVVWARANAAGLMFRGEIADDLIRAMRPGRSWFPRLAMPFRT